MLNRMARRHVVRAFLATLVVVALIAPCAASIASAAMPSHHTDADCMTRLCDLPTGCTAPTIVMAAIAPVALVSVCDTDDVAAHTQPLRLALVTAAPSGAPVHPLASRSPPLV